MSDSLHPSEGLRLLLERQSVSDNAAQAKYRGSIYTPSEVFRFNSELYQSGEVEMSPEVPGNTASDEQVEKLLRIAKSTARAAKRKVEEGLPPWPSRVLRWRGPGRG